MKTPTLFLALTLFTGALLADEFAPLFPFVITGDVGGNITDVSAWNDAPAGKHGFIGDKITVGNRWGNEPVLCEGIPFSLCFEKAKSLKCFPFDEDGNRRTEIKTDGNEVELGPQYKTVWYEIELR